MSEHETGKSRINQFFWPEDLVIRRRAKEAVREPTSGDHIGGKPGSKAGQPGKGYRPGRKTATRRQGKIFKRKGGGSES